MAIIDLTAQDTQAALDDWADALERQAEQLDALDATFRAEVARLLEPAGQQVTVDHVCVGADVWLCGTWHRVAAKVTDTDARGRRTVDLVVCDGTHPAWDYPVLDGEHLTVRAPF